MAFALLVCDRMLPGLYAFSRETGFDGTIYYKCLESAWQNLAGDGGLRNYDSLAGECLASAPDTEDSDHPLVSVALSAALSIAAIMRFLSDFSVDHVVEESGLAVDTAALYAQHVDAVAPRSFDLNEVASHRFVRQELERQADDLKFLAALPADVLPQIVPILIERARLAPKLLPGVR